MADRTYELEYLLSGNALSQIQALTAAITALHSEATSAGTALSGMLANTPRAAGRAARSVDSLNSSVAGLGRSASTTTASLDGVGNAAATLRPAGQGISDSFTGLGAAMLKVQGTMGVINGLARPFAEATERIEARWAKIAEHTAEFQEKNRETANLMGHAGPDNEVLARQLKLATAAALTSDEAQGLTQSWLNFAPTVKSKGHIAPPAGQTQDQLEDQLVAETGILARRIGMDPKIAGAALGSAGMFHKFTDTRSAMEQVGGAAEGLSLGISDFNTGFDYLNRVSAKMVSPEEAAAEGASPGKVNSFAEAGTYLGVLTLGAGDADVGAQQMLQMSRTVNPPLKKPRAAAALKKAGVTDAMSDPEKVIALSDYFKQENVADPLRWLEANDLGTQATRAVAVGAFKNADQLRERLAKVRESAQTGATGKTVMDLNAQSMRDDPVAQAAKVRAGAQGLDIVQGLQGARDLEEARKAADLRMRLHDPSYDLPTGGWARSLYSFATNPMFGESGERFNQATNPTWGAIPVARRAARKAGIDTSPFEGELGSDNPRERERGFGRLAAAMRQAGVDPSQADQTLSEVKAQIGTVEPGGKFGPKPPAPPQAGAIPGAAGAAGGALGPRASLGEMKVFDPDGHRLLSSVVDELRKLSGKVTGGGGMVARAGAGVFGGQQFSAGDALPVGDRGPLRS